MDKNELIATIKKEVKAYALPSRNMNSMKVADLQKLLDDARRLGLTNSKIVTLVLSKENLFTLIEKVEEENVRRGTPGRGATTIVIDFDTFDIEKHNMIHLHMSEVRK